MVFFLFVLFCFVFARYISGKYPRLDAKNQAPIRIVGKKIKEIEEFTYLGAKVNKEGGGMEDLQNRLSKARGTYIRLIKIWNSKSISKRTKIKLYKTLFLPVLMYG